MPMTIEENAMPGAEDASLDHRLATLRDSYGATLPDKLARLQELGRRAAACDDWRDMQPLLRDIRATLHMLAGSAPTFGYHDVGDMARTMEHLLDRVLAADTLPPMSRMAELQGILAVMAGAGQASPVTKMAGRLAILTHQDGTGHGLARALQRHGYATALIDNQDAMRAMPADLPLQAVLVESTPDGLGPTDWLSMLRQRRLTMPPVVFFGEQGDFTARHAAIRAGAAGYLLEPLAIPDLPAQLEAMIAAEPFRPYRILGVGDGMPGLDGSGILHRALSDPAALLMEMEDFRPDLLLLNLAMTDYDAIDLARLVWQHGRHDSVGIFFASPGPAAGSTLLAHGITDAYCLSGPLDSVTMRARAIRYLHECRAGQRRPNRADLAPHLPRMAKLALGGAGIGEVLPARPIATAAEPSQKQRPKVLIVDDDEYLVASLAIALTSRGMEVLRAHGGEQGYTMAWQHMPRVIVSDVEMPNGSGDRMILQLRGNARTRNIPVIIMTGRRWEDGRDYALERELRGRLGAASYLQKPVEVETLVKELARL